jgi:hypothetical protein
LNRLVPDRALGFLEPSCGVPRTRRQRLPRELTNLLLKLTDTSAQLIFLLGQFLQPSGSLRAGLLAAGRLHALLNLALLPHEIVGAPLGVLSGGLRTLLLILAE